MNPIHFLFGLSVSGCVFVTAYMVIQLANAQYWQAMVLALGLIMWVANASYALEKLRKP